MLILRQTLDRPISGYWDGGKKQVFNWNIERTFSDGKSRVGSWGANYFFEVATGRSERDTLSNAKRALRARAARRGIACTFKYIEE